MTTERVPESRKRPPRTPHACRCADPSDHMRREAYLYGPTEIEEAVVAERARIAEAVRGLRLAEGGGDPEHEDAVWQYNAGLDAALVIVERT